MGYATERSLISPPFVSARGDICFCTALKSMDRGVAMIATFDPCRKRHWVPLDTTESTDVSSKLSRPVAVLFQMVSSVILLLLVAVTTVQPLPRPQGNNHNKRSAEPTTPYPETPGPRLLTSPPPTEGTPPTESPTSFPSPEPTVITGGCRRGFRRCGHSCCRNGSSPTNCPPGTYRVGRQCIPFK